MTKIIFSDEFVLDIPLEKPTTLYSLFVHMAKNKKLQLALKLTREQFNKRIDAILSRMEYTRIIANGKIISPEYLVGVNENLDLRAYGGFE